MNTEFKTIAASQSANVQAKKILNMFLSDEITMQNVAEIIEDYRSPYSAYIALQIASWLTDVQLCKFRYELAKIIDTH